MKWKIPLSDVDIRQEEREAVDAVLESGWLSMGPRVAQFEDEFARYLGVKHAISVTNCTVGLNLACKALGIGEGDEVLCPSLTFVATANAIVYSGGTPVFADITSLEVPDISPEDIIRKISPRTKAVMVMHYAGYPCDMDAITRIAKEKNLYVIEDAAHALGAEYKGKKAGAAGDVGIFSFFPNKNITTGEGGMIVTNNGELAGKMRLMRSHGMTTLTWDRHKGHVHSYDVVELGFNYRMDELRAALGSVQLERLDENNGLRRKLTDSYRKALSGFSDIIVPFAHYEHKSSHHILPLVIVNDNNRPVLIGKMEKAGVQTSVHYPPVHLFDFYRKKYGYKEGVLPVTEEFSRKEITLPLYPAMATGDIDYITGVLRSFFK